MMEENFAFLGINPEFDILESLTKYGVLCSKKEVNGRYLYIIGIDSHTQLGGPSEGYDLFILKRYDIRDLQVLYNLLCPDTTWDKFIGNSIRNNAGLLWKMFETSKLSRLDIAHKYLGITNINDYKTRTFTYAKVLEMLKSKNNG